MSYTKLHKEILYSTIWQEPSHVRVVWITMLALRDERNQVQASVPGLADAAKVSRAQVEEALTCFMKPDPDSRSQEFEGRRIEKCDGGWELLNGEKFRQKQSVEERKEYMRKYMRDRRERSKIAKDSDVNLTVNNVKNVKKCNTVEYSRVEYSKVNNKGIVDANASTRATVHLFDAFWNLYPKKRGKGAAEKSWFKIKPSQKLCKKICESVSAHLQSPDWQKDGGQFIPNPATFLNQKRWEDEPATYKQESFTGAKHRYNQSKSKAELAIDMMNHREGTQNEPR